MRKLYLALGLCVAAAACGSDDDIKRGGAGESCTSSNDCSGPLICDRGICATKGATTTPDGGAPVTPTVLSGPGESCTKTADCVTGYRCFSAVCSLAAPSPEPVKTDAAVINVIVVSIDAGAPVPTNPVLGGRGETCAVSRDCETGLICLPLSDATGLGICDISNYGFQPSANSCYAECKQDVDCCELPLGLTGTSPDAGTVNFNSCADLLKAMTPYVGSNCGDQPTISHQCFLYKTYCNCAASNPWKCTAEKRCSYTASCDPTIKAEIMKGCPAQTRAGFPVDACNATTKTCAAVAATGGCKTNDDCTGSPVADVAGETCAPGECICLVTAGTCYRKCDADLDCRPGYGCDTTQKLCKPSGDCTTDAFCATTLKNAGAKCATIAGTTTKACKLPCKSDQDCSPSGLSGSVFTGSVCGTDGFCGAMGCTSDAECSRTIAGAGAVKMFCATPVVGATVQWTSAITD